MPDSPNPNIVSSYTRADALADGVLIDITANAHVFGFKLPTAIPDALLQLSLPPEVLEGNGQSMVGRLHSLLGLATVVRYDNLTGLQTDRPSRAAG
jgi:hypothetical protein